ncbi:hypothetical protein ILUMI_05834 [Ignelater luminosus]|uniref:Dynein attachment factor N-terminal domain-containing protein n=1 Tax=Ignelater luminosus TaxID=2038154 RepID=A0A8K0DCA3_IGNLU|nr:hypothetical protein ILUMI_05834 [Ignelater luminosus]
MSQPFTKINSKALFEELQSAIEEDKRYWIQNDAKIRASTTAKNYDEFRETVAAAHLMSLTKKDMAKKIQTWNSTVRNSSQAE